MPRIAAHHTPRPFPSGIGYGTRKATFPLLPPSGSCHYQSLSTDVQAQGPANSRQPRAFLHQAEPQRLTYTGISPCCSRQKLSFFDLLSGTKIQSFPCPPSADPGPCSSRKSLAARTSLTLTHTHFPFHLHPRSRTRWRRIIEIADLPVATPSLTLLVWVHPKGLASPKEGTAAPKNNSAAVLSPLSHRPLSKDLFPKTRWKFFVSNFLLSTIKEHLP